MYMTVYPQRAVSIGMTCFLRLITPGEEHAVVLGRDGECLLYLVVRTDIEKVRAFKQHVRYHEDDAVKVHVLLSFAIIARNSSCRESRWLASTQVIWLTPRFFSAMWNCL